MGNGKRGRGRVEGAWPKDLRCEFCAVFVEATFADETRSSWLVWRARTGFACFDRAERRAPAASHVWGRRILYEEETQNHKAAATVFAASEPDQWHGISLDLNFNIFARDTIKILHFAGSSNQHLQTLYQRVLKRKRVGRIGHSILSTLEVRRRTAAWRLKQSRDGITCSWPATWSTRLLLARSSFAPCPPLPAARITRVAVGQPGKQEAAVDVVVPKPRIAT